MKRIFLLVGLIGALGYIGLMLYAYIRGPQRIFPCPASTYSDEEGLLRIPTQAGHYTLIQVWQPTIQPNGYTLIYNHGNAQDLGLVREYAEHFAHFGFQVIAYEYPGMGLLPGTQNEASIYDAAEAVYDYAIHTLHVPESKIIEYGYSLGSGPATEMAVRHPIGGLILEGAFASTFRIVTCWKVLPWDIFDNIGKIHCVDCPILLVHGMEDCIVPLSHGLRLAKASKTPTLTFFVPAATHFNPLKIDPKGYEKALEAFLEITP